MQGGFVFFTDLRCSGSDGRCNVVRGWRRADSFYPHDAKLVQYLPSSCVCSFNCPSATSLCSTKTAKPSIMQTMPYVSPGTLVPKITAKFQKVSPNGGTK